MRNLNRFELTRLETLVSLTQDQMKNVLAAWLKKYYKDNVIIHDDYLCAEGNIPIALVAHMDTVFKMPPTTEEIYYDQKKNVMWSPKGLGADDRAGIFAILSIVNSGLKPHIIFTTDEEIGAVGASELANIPCPFKELKYLIQLDRRGVNDCVFYDCDNKKFVKYVENFGFLEAWGSFSDISVICPAWKVAGVNLSVGYMNEHNFIETLNISALLTTIKKVKKMLSEKDIPFFEYIPAPVFYGKGFGFAPKYMTSCICPKCGETHQIDDCFNTKMLDGSYKYICQDCAMKPENKITWCNKCYEAFEYSGDYPPMLCIDCIYDEEHEDAYGKYY